MSEPTIDFPAIITKFDKILKRGLCSGVGKRDGRMCIEAAICAAMELPHGDDPSCVAPAVRRFKITLNDSAWSSPNARAKGLRDLGIAQIGSKGIVDDKKFTQLLQRGTIQRLIPDLFRRCPIKDPVLRQPILDAADLCEKSPTHESAAWAAEAAEAARAAWAAGAAWAAKAAGAAWAARAARAAGAAGAAWAAEADHFLLLSASIALDVLKELNSPGVVWLDYKD